MTEVEKHIPGQTDAAVDEESSAEGSEAEDTEHQGDSKVDETKEESEPGEKSDDESKPDEGQDDGQKDETPGNQVVVPKKRSIYDEYKGQKKENKELKAQVEAANAKIVELTDLLSKKDQAVTPAEKAEVEDELEAFANTNKLDPTSLNQLVGIIEKRVSKGIKPSEGLSEEDKATLARAREREAQEQRQAEDAETRKAAPFVQKELGIANAAELETVMNEIVKLSHTDAFHDKEPEYILWKNRATLSKLVSPKKPSFESGDSRQDAEGGAEVDFSSGKVTPEQAGTAMVEQARGPGYEVRKQQK